MESASSGRIIKVGNLGRQKPEGRRQKAEGKRQKVGGRSQKPEGRSQKVEENKRNESKKGSIYYHHTNKIRANGCLPLQYW